MNATSSTFYAQRVLRLLGQNDVEGLAGLPSDVDWPAADFPRSRRPEVNFCLLIEAPPCRSHEFEFSLLDVASNKEIGLDEFADFSERHELHCTHIAVHGDFLDFEDREFWRTVPTREAVKVLAAMLPFLKQCCLELDQVDMALASAIMGFFHGKHHFTDLRLTFYAQSFTPLMEEFIREQLSIRNPGLENVELEGDLLPASLRGAVTPLLGRRLIPSVSLNATNIVFDFGFFEKILLFWFSVRSPKELSERRVFAYFDFDRSRLLEYLTVVDPEDELLLGRRYAANGAAILCRVSAGGDCLTLHFFGSHSQFLSDEDAQIFSDRRLCY